MPKATAPASPLTNQLLAALPKDEYQQLRPNLEPFPLVFEEVIYEPGDSIRYVSRNSCVPGTRSHKILAAFSLPRTNQTIGTRLSAASHTCDILRAKRVACLTSGSSSPTLPLAIPLRNPAQFETAN